MRVLRNTLLFLCLQISLFAQDDLYNVVPINAVNSAYQDYAPLFPDSVTMLFTSSRPNAQAERNMANNYNIFISHKQGETWSAPELVSYLSNSDNHEATSGLSSDRKTVFIYKTFNGGDIYSSDFGTQKLSALKKSHFNTPYQESSACFVANTLFFVSDKPEGKGGKDIYSCENNGKGWSDPVNLQILNSDKDENFVSVTTGGDTLFFSSKGHSSFGGYDVFKSVRKKDGQWSEPQNMGKLINTTFDEIGFTLDPGGVMYFSSNKPGSGNDGFNIYACIEKKVIAKIPLKITGNSPLVVSKKGSVELIKPYVEVEGYKRHLPKSFEVNIYNVKDTIDVIRVSDLNISGQLSVLDSKDQPVIRIKKFVEKLENLSLEDVKKYMNFEINYCAVQVGAFTWKTSITDFVKDFPLLDNKVIMIQTNNVNRFVMRETFEELDSAIVLQKKCIVEYHSVFDTFVAVYDMKNRRHLIYFDYARNKFKILRPEEQVQDDGLIRNQ